MIEIEGLSKKFGDLEVLKDINLRIEDGDIYGLVGISGAGKSTLLRCMNGLISYDAGSIKIDNTEVKSLTKKELCFFQKDIAMIFQNFNLMSRKTVYQNIAFPMKCWKYPKEEIDKRVRELAEIVGISDKLNQKPNTLSGGQKQRVAIARALTMNPKILLSDEATSALDPITTQSIMGLLRDINKNLGITIVLVTHQMSVIQEVCNNISLLENGRLIESGPVEKIFLEQPYAFRRFLGERIAVPEEGYNLQIMFSDDKDSKYLLSKMSRELKVDFVIVSGKMERYKEKNLGSLILNFEEKDIEEVKRYLTEKDMIWHEYTGIKGEEIC